jgi:hypothetical protein
VSQAVRLLAAFGVFAAVLVGLIYFKPCVFGAWDFLQYWTAAEILSAGGNPYNPVLMHSVQRVLVCDRSFELPVLLWNPPLVFGLLMPLALIPFDAASAVWMFISVVLLVVSFELLMRIFLIPHAKRSLLLVLLLTVPAVYLNLWWGQISAWLFLGLSLFLYFSARGKSEFSNTFVGGLGLSITLIKPHLLCLLYLFLLIDSVRAKKFYTIAGLMLGGIALTTLSLIIKWDIWINYFQALQSAPPFYWKTPSLGSYFQELSAGLLSSEIARFVPIILAALVTYPAMLSAAKEQRVLPVVLLVTCFSILFSPYSWAFDQLLLIPVLVFLFAQSAFTAWHLFLIFALNITGLVATNFVTQEFFLFYSLSITLVFLLLFRHADRAAKLSATRP